MWEQVHTLLWLKVRIFRNTFTKGKALPMFIIGIFLAALLLLSMVLGALAGWGGYQVGGQFEDNSKNPFRPTVLLLLPLDLMLFLFFVFWGIGLVTELQRSDILDFRKMLHLPISVRMVFGLNFGMSLFRFLLPLFWFPWTGYCFGLSLSLGPRMLLAYPLGLLFYLMVAAWTHWIQGVLSFLMENKKRRRTILVLVPLVFVFLGQVPNLLLIHSKHHGRHEVKQVEQAPAADPEQEARQKAVLARERSRRVQKAAIVGNAVVPPGWLPLGVWGLAAGPWWVTPLSYAGLGGLGALGMTLSYRSTMRFYLGVTSKRRKRPKTPRRVRKSIRKGRVMAWTLPGFSEETSAVTTLCLLTLLRHPQIRIALVMPVIVGAILFGVFLRGVAMDGVMGRALMPTAFLVWPFFSFIHLYTNVFGVDRDGFKTFLLLPTARRHILLGKNMAFLVIAGGLALIFWAGGALLLNWPLSVVLIAPLQIIQLHLCFTIIGNPFSLYFPFTMRLPSEGKSGSGAGWRKQMTLLLLTPVFLSAVALATIPTLLGLSADYLLGFFYNYRGPWVGLLVTALTLTGVLRLYRLNLSWSAETLQRREQKILDALLRGKE